MRYLYSEEFGRLAPLIKDAVKAALGQPIDQSRFGLEALVRLTGRPALEVHSDFVDLSHPEAAEWKHLWSFKEPIERLARSVGRIDLNGVHVGTGFVIAPGAILTNRHVLEEVAKAYRSVSGDETWLLSAGQLTINFDAEHGSQTAKRFSITGVIAAGPDPINRQINLNHVDAAVLVVSMTNEEDQAFPSPVTFAKRGSDTVKTAVEIITIGYPGSARFAPKGPTITEEEVKIDQALKRVFNYTPGVKRLSPGLVLTPAGQLQGDTVGGIFTHDASTLEGASGSVIARLSGADLEVIGIHFGGRTMKWNYGLTGASLEKTLFSTIDVEWSGPATAHT